MPRALIRIVVTGSALALFSSAAWAQTPSDADRYAYGPHMMWWGGGGYAMILGPLFMILVLAVLIAAVALLVRWVGGPWQGTPHRITRRLAAQPSIFSRSALRGAKSIRTSSSSGAVCSAIELSSLDDWLMRKSHANRAPSIERRKDVCADPVHPE